MSVAFRRVLAIFCVLLFTTFSFPQKSSKNSKKKAANEQPVDAANPSAAPEQAKKEEEDPLFKGLTWRLVGPFRGGRVLAVSESDPNVVYVGTGEACIRNNILQGNGMYKSTDAGKTWHFIGLEDTRHIGRLAVHPKNPDIVFVAALGHAYGRNTERGVFRSTDGGKTWQKVLYNDDQTGAIDVVFDPSNPSILYAALWQAYRTPYSMVSGGPGSGLYRSADGGTTWTQIKGNGFPTGV